MSIFALQWFYHFSWREFFRRRSEYMSVRRIAYMLVVYLFVPSVCVFWLSSFVSLFSNPWLLFHVHCPPRISTSSLAQRWLPYSWGAMVFCMYCKTSGTAVLPWLDLLEKGIKNKTELRSLASFIFFFFTYRKVSLLVPVVGSTSKNSSKTLNVFKRKKQQIYFPLISGVVVNCLFIFTWKQITLSSSRIFESFIFSAVRSSGTKDPLFNREAISLTHPKTKFFSHPGEF